MEGGKLEETKKDVDWWIDQAIIELQWLEERFPAGDWGSVQLQESPLPMRNFYRRIAQFRRDHPRRHSVPLETDSLKRINKFVEKYQ